MDNTRVPTAIEVYNVGRRDGFIAGVCVSWAVYWGWQAIKAKKRLDQYDHNRSH